MLPLCLTLFFGVSVYVASGNLVGSYQFEHPGLFNPVAGSLQRAQRVCQTNDGSYVMSGLVQNGLSVVKVGSDGSIEWAQSFEGDHRQTYENDGKGLVYDSINDRVIAFGQSRNNGPWLQLVLKGSDGSLTDYQDFDVGRFGGIRQAKYSTSDETVVLLGSSFLLKLNASDYTTPVWTTGYNTINGSITDFVAESLVVTSDGKNIIVGQWHDDDNRFYGILMCVASDGLTIDWIQPLRIRDSDTLMFSVTQLSDDSIVVGGTVATDVFDEVLFFGRFSSADGSLFWLKEIEWSPELTMWPTSLTVNSADEIFAVGFRDEDDAYALKFDSQGVLQWNRKYTDRELRDVIYVPDRAVAVAVGQVTPDLQLLLAMPNEDGRIIDGESSACGSHYGTLELLSIDEFVMEDDLDQIFMEESTFTRKSNTAVTSDDMTYVSSTTCDSALAPTSSSDESKDLAYTHSVVVAWLCAVFVYCAWM